MLAVQTVVDFFSRQPAATLACFKAAGVDGIARYLTATPDDPRSLTRPEVDDAHAAGLSVHMVYEMDPTYPAYFTRAQGETDCRNAIARLIELDAPVPSVVYLSVDTDIDPALVTEYLNGAESAATPRITLGLYGYQRLCEYARANFPNIGRHLFQTYGTVTGALDLWQHLQEDRCGVQVDVNDASVEGWMSDQFVTKAELEAYKAALQKQLDATYAKKGEIPAHGHNGTVRVD